MTEGIHSIHTGKRIEDETDSVIALIESLTEDTTD
jgi:hypothetical protein